MAAINSLVPGPFTFVLAFVLTEGIVYIVQDILIKQATKFGTVLALATFTMYTCLAGKLRVYLNVQ